MVKTISKLQYNRHKNNSRDGLSQLSFSISYSGFWTVDDPAQTSTQFVLRVWAQSHGLATKTSKSNGAKKILGCPVPTPQ